METRKNILLEILDNKIFAYDNKLKSKRVIGIEECFELLNQQDRRIKELENMNCLRADSENQFCEVVKRLKQEITRITQLYDELNKKYCKQQDEFDVVKEENQQLKQSQKQLAIGELEKLHEIFRNTVSDLGMCKFICTVVENQIEKLEKYR